MLAYVEWAGEREKNNKVHYVLQVRTLNGLLKLKFWNVGRKDFPSTGNYLELRIKDLRGASEEIGTYGDISLDSLYGKTPLCEFVVLNEEDVPEDVRKEIKKDRNKQRLVAAEMLKDASHWRDLKVHEFLLSFVKNNAEKFVTAPAAIEKHHDYKGGLFIHTAEVFGNCVAIFNNPCNASYERKIDKDALMLAAWFHDAGKMEIYWMEGDVPNMDSERESAIGHTTISNQIFLKASEGCGFDPRFVDLVSHCILSHHQIKEWGAVVEPMTVEANILCRADFISSRMPD